MMMATFRFAAVAVAALASSSQQPINPNDPQVAKALMTAQHYAIRFYRIHNCDTGMGFRYGVNNAGDLIVVDVKPVDQKVVALKIRIRRTDLKVISINQVKRQGR